MAGTPAHALRRKMKDRKWGKTEHLFICRSLP
jgi:hypothetical protein